MSEKMLHFTPFSSVSIFEQVNVCWVIMSYPAGIYMFKVNNKNTRSRCEICSKLTVKTPKGY